MNRPGLAAKAVPRMVPSPGGGSPWVPSVLQAWLELCRRNKKKLQVRWVMLVPRVGSLLGAGRWHSGRTKRREKKPKGFACRSSTAAASVQHRARAPLTARLTCEQALASEIWGQPAGFGDGRAESLVPSAA